ncbi:unnamed protein product [Adineta ricciae]|uniref:Uncharacterized protein n=1 Tax=Adineta ricciae TaxID=249248 RepID=A0A815VSI8_ADIRI|nr:unnamed protein product [Adineta ricciae]
MCLFIFILIVILIISLRFQRSIDVKYLTKDDLIKYGNVNGSRKRIPRLIHQTYETLNIPPIWNKSIQSILETNSKDFQYIQWTHKQMKFFVKKHEPKFYHQTYVHYKYEMQRIDSFRYVLMYHLGGIYLDMDNGCNYPLESLLTTIETLNPNSTFLVLFPQEDTFGIQTDFIVSTAKHPIFRQFISNLHSFNHYYILHHLTILLSAGPLFATFQERFFRQTNEEIVRILQNQVYKSIFWKTNGGSWNLILNDIHSYLNPIFLYQKDIEIDHFNSKMNSKDLDKKSIQISSVVFRQEDVENF